MGRRVKCQDTGEFSNSDVAYKALDNKYYSSKEAYLLIHKSIIDRQKVIDMFMDILGYTPEMKVPTILFKKLKEYESYGYETVIKTIELNIQAINWAMNNKDFDRDANKIFYIFAIIQNNINDTVRIIKNTQKEQVEKNTDVKIDTLNISNNIQKTKDIRKWLEDE